MLEDASVDRKQTEVPSCPKPKNSALRMQAQMRTSPGVLVRRQEADCTPEDTHKQDKGYRQQTEADTR